MVIQWLICCWNNRLWMSPSNNLWSQFHFVFSDKWAWVIWYAKSLEVANKRVAIWKTKNPDLYSRTCLGWGRNCSIVRDTGPFSLYFGGPRLARLETWKRKWNYSAFASATMGNSGKCVPVAPETYLWNSQKWGTSPLGTGRCVIMPTIFRMYCENPPFLDVFPYKSYKPLLLFGGFP